MNKSRFVPLTTTLMRGTLLLALFCAAAVLAVQTWFIVQRHSRQFEIVVDEIATSAVPLLSMGLRDIELKTVQQQLDMIARRPEIGFVLLRTAADKQFSAGRSELRDGSVSLRIKVPALPSASNGGGTMAGELTLVGNRQYLIDQVLANAWQMLLSLGTFTAVMCIIVMSMLRRELQAPLQRLSKFATELTPETLTRPLTLLRPHHTHTDEIDQLADGFAKLQVGLREHIATLDKNVEERTEQLRALAEANHVLSITDELTGCLNRRTLDLRLREEVGRCRRYGRTLSVIGMDIDHFKRINDTHGHAAGDAVLRKVGLQLRASIRASLDWTVRMGGEEFLIVLPETDLTAASAYAERLHSRLSELVITHDGIPLRITVSMGVSQLQDAEDGLSLIRRADQLLYDAKNAGRNRVRRA
ncbi:MAG: hypothetical protein RLZZ126_432 [Pseudomonadota bacterium]|jgi:two-component system, cell cycle response regulator